MSDKTQRPIFLSSCFADPEDVRLDIRDRVVEATGGMLRSATRPVWMAEDFRELDRDSPLGPFDKAELCLDGVRAAECFVAIITTRHGSKVAIDGAGTVPSSFFEAELFEAALLGKPSFVFLLEGHDPSPKLANLLRLLAPFFPHMNLRPVSEDHILKELDALIRYYQRPWWIRKILRPPQLRPLVRTLFKTRHRAYEVKTEPPPVRFLDGMFDPSLTRPDPAVVSAVLERADKTEKHQARLTLLWFAIRALMGAPYTKPENESLLSLWDHALGAWTTAGAWYGLHGHTSLGCLGSLGSISDVRMRLDRSGDAVTAIPHGPLASEYYSTARLAGRSKALLHLALEHIDAALSNGREIANHTAIRASIYRDMGMADRALADYRHVADIKKDRGDASYGEALNELGYALLRLGQIRRGLADMEKGLELLRHAPASGFQVRAMRKLAVGYASAGRLGAALDLALEARELALKLGAYDQVRWLERLAVRLDKLRPWRHWR